MSERMANLYEFRIKGQIDPSLSAWLNDLLITHTPDGDSLLSGPVIDQAALHGLLARCRDLGLTLISFNPIESTNPARENTRRLK